MNQSEWHEKNKDKQREYQRKWVEKNRDKVNQMQRERIKKLKETEPEKMERLKKQRSEAMKRYYEKNKELHKQSMKDYNVEKRAELAAKQRERYHKQKLGDMSTDDYMSHIPGIKTLEDIAKEKEVQDE